MLFGGESSEHSVSMISARNVFAAMDKDRYDVFLCYIDRSGRFWGVNEIVEVELDDAVELSAQLGMGSFKASDGTVIRPDVIFPMLHGVNGEDGSVQALAQLLHVPVVGCDMTASAISMSKRMAKQIAFANGVTTLAYNQHHISDDVPKYEELKRDLGDVMFVKPDGAGSSIGISMVKNQTTLEVALAEAHKYGEIALIEKGLNHPRELEVAVLGSYPDIRVSAVAEVRPGADFYSFESKYDSSSKSEVVIPADIPDEYTELIKTQAKYIYRLLGCKGMARIDFFSANDTLYFNEINTIPGFTNISVYPKAWEAEGVAYGELIDLLITDALKK